jgi:hypothetical protein
LTFPPDIQEHVLGPTRVSITARFGRIQAYKEGHAMNLKNLPNPAKMPGFSGFLGF